MLTRKQSKTKVQSAPTIVEHRIIMPSDELKPKTVVLIDTQKFVIPFFSPQNEASLQGKVKSHETN